MRCMLCEGLSFTHICSTCQETFLSPSLYKRKILHNIEVLSFYKYSQIKELLLTKHTDLGYYTYSILAKNSFEKFTQNFVFPHAVVSIAIDDHVRSGYSHTAILNKTLQSSCIKPLYNKLRAENDISYAGKSREFRLLHPRKFQLKRFSEEDVILVDDIITTGFTLGEAVNAMRQAGKNVLFCITLADASLK